MVLGTIFFLGGGLSYFLTVSNYFSKKDGPKIGHSVSFFVTAMETEIAMENELAVLIEPSVEIEPAV